MRISIFSYSDRGCQLALRIAALYQAQGDVAACHAIAKFATKYQLHEVPSTSEGACAQFSTSDVMIFVGACGIAVRALAPLLVNKVQDPACLVVDDTAQFVIPLVSGHIGGANAQAQWLAMALAAAPVVTTATDVNQRFSVDAFAAQRGFAISSMARAKAFSAQILTQDLPLVLGEHVRVGTPLPKGLYLAGADDVSAVQEKLYIGYQTSSTLSDEPWLRLTPKMITLGIGCKKGTPMEYITALVQEILYEKKISPDAVRCVASIDLKANEAGLLAFCEEYKYPFWYYSAQQLQAVQGNFAFTPSKFVQSVTGVDNVCERAAVLAAQQPRKTAPVCAMPICGIGVDSAHVTANASVQNQHFVCRKISRNGVTLAVVAQELEVCFG